MKHKSFKALIWALAVTFILSSGTAFGYAVGIQEDFPETIAVNNPSPGEAEVPAATDQFIVKYKDTTSEAEENQIEKEEKAPTKETIEKIDTDVLEVPEGKDSHQMVSEFRAEHADKIEYAELDGIAEPQFVPNDPAYQGQWNLQKIQAADAWEITKGSSDVTVAVLDTGVQTTHSDLKNRGITGWNVVSDNNDFSDINSHGTSVSAVITAQTNNAIAIAGLAIEPKLMMVRITNNSSGSATDSNIAKGIIYAADHGAKVVNLSYGGNSNSALVQEAVDYAHNKGVVVAAAACNYNSSTPCYPAAMNHVIAVGATDRQDQKASFSNYGSWIDVTAPGVDIYTIAFTRDLAVTMFGGTSAAVPHVTGLAALAFSINPELSADQVEGYITGNTDDLGTAGKDDIFGWGRINVYKTLYAINPAYVPPTPEPNAITNFPPQPAVRQ